MFWVERLPFDLLYRLRQTSRQSKTWMDTKLGEQVQLLKNYLDGNYIVHFDDDYRPKGTERGLGYANHMKFGVRELLDTLHINFLELQPPWQC
jgi:hypothetical protein